MHSSLFHVCVDSFNFSPIIICMYSLLYDFCEAEVCDNILCIVSLFQEYFDNFEKCVKDR